ncbi:MAG: DUF3703 domain-containing protein [Hydrogenophaga sp.]|nr:DUF3703 domain-containing protein [Hydrogenophaga sp.]
MPTPHDATRLQAVFDELIQQSARAPDARQAWLYLEAAHVVGQLRLRPHVRSHWHMLRLAARTGDAPEVLGQLFRLALVPLGHLSGRLPIGNPGRANVSAFEPMAVRPELGGLIEQARRGM